MAVLGAVHDAGLQRLVHLGEGHHLGNGAERTHLRVEHLRGLDAHLQAAEILGLPERLVGAHVLEAVVPIREADDALGLELLQQSRADRPARHLVELVVVVEEVGQVEDLELAHAQRAELREGRREHLHGTELQRLDLLLVLVQRAVGVHLDLHAALGALLGELLEVFGALALRRVGGDDVAELDDDRLLAERGRGSERERGRGGRREKRASIHDSPSGLIQRRC
jgi:hypothetical protein